MHHPACTGARYRPVEHCSIAVGTALAFRFSTGHNVWLMPSEAAYVACDFSQATELASVITGGGQPGWSPLYQAVATEVGELLFACGAALRSHCGRGQKIRVTVSSAPPPSPPDVNPCFGSGMFVLASAASPSASGRGARALLRRGVRRSGARGCHDRAALWRLRAGICREHDARHRE